MNTIMPKRALVSVSDKTNLDQLIPVLVENNVEIISTGGTAEFLKKMGVKYTPINEVTGNPEAFGGRMKSISFQVSSALLYRRDHPTDMKEAKELNIKDIDLVVCNLYPFKEVAAKENISRADLIENIDIGGPNMIRGAAKNMQWVTVVTDPGDYESLSVQLKSGGTTLESRSQFALKAFSLTAQYDLAIATTLAQEFNSEFPAVFSHNVKPLRYGENPHQKAKLFIFDNQKEKMSLAKAPVLQGKEISYNNYLDSDQAYKCVSELALAFPSREHCVIVKHGIPCGVSSSTDQFKTLRAAWDCDSTSAFGGIIAFSSTVKAEAAEWLTQQFIEVVIAPSYTPEALAHFAKKKNIRLVEVPLKKRDSHEWTVRSINGGILWQEEDEKTTMEFRTPTKKSFGTNQTDLTKFGLIITKYLKSNCLLLVDEREGAFTILASGVGQPNRLECLTLLAGPRMKQKDIAVNEAILVSDAFFPFRDSIEEANKWGVKFVVQPGGSIKDPDVIAACDEFGMAMVMTGERHFRH
jgi:phosphoribosylaminoimidazolecarboxamide formyltransferase / IMP cyclohydrolase